MHPENLKKALDRIEYEIERVKEDLERAKWRAMKQGEDTLFEQVEAEETIIELRAHRDLILYELGGVKVEYDTGGYTVRDRATQIRSYLGSRDWESSSSG